MFWFNREDPRAVFVDKREAQLLVVDRGTAGTRGRKPKRIRPGVVADFTALPFAANSFNHVVFDPPHLLGTPSSSGLLMFAYGSLRPQWKEDLRAGFSECFRVLKCGGTLIFKWSETQIPLREVLALTPHCPLYGHRTGKKAQTHWVAFVKTA